MHTISQNFYLGKVGNFIHTSSPAIMGNSEKLGDRMSRVIVFFLIMGGLGFGIYKFLKGAWLYGEEKKQQKEALDEIRNRTCPHCGRQIHYKRVICPYCYENLKDNCPNCGEIVDKDISFCPHCGVQLTTQESESACNPNPD